MYYVLRLLLLLSVTNSLFSCKLKSGYITDEKPTVSSIKPESGAQVDTECNFLNNCDQNLYVYYYEVSPGDKFQCDQIKGIGQLLPKDDINVIVHKGKIGYIVFADNTNGRCNVSDRRSVQWIDCSQAKPDSPKAKFTTCPTKGTQD